MTSPRSSPRPEPVLNAAAPLSIEDPGDALGLVQHTFGDIPQDSLVLIGLMDGATGGHLRVDLGPVRTDQRQFGERCALWIAGPDAAPVPEAVLAVIFDSHRPDEDSPDIYDVLLAALADRLMSEADAKLVKVWHCGDGYIRDYECWDRRCCSYPGEDAINALNSALRRVPALAGTRAFSPDEAVAAFLSFSPLVDEERINLIKGQADAAPEHPQEMLSIWDAALSRSTDEHGRAGGADSDWVMNSPADAAGLLGTLENRGMSGLLMGLSAVGFEAVVTWVSGGERCPDQWSSAVWGSSDVPPRWERMEAMDALLHQLAPFADGVQIEQILGLKAWLEWTRGRGRHATAFAQKLRDLDPERWNDEQHRPLARIVLTQIAAIGVCPWAQVKQSSYSWWASSSRNFSP